VKFFSQQVQGGPNKFPAWIWRRQHLAGEDKNSFVLERREIIIMARLFIL
jgi:hypothetical protein